MAKRVRGRSTKRVRRRSTKRVRRRSTKRSQRKLSKRLTKRRLSKRRLSKRRSKGRVSKRRVKRGGNPTEESMENYITPLPSDVINCIANKLPLKDLQSLINAYPCMEVFLQSIYNSKAIQLLNQLGITDEDTTLVNLSNNEAVNDDTINEILHALTALPNLTELYLDNNALTALPDSLANLKSLVALHLNNNRLRALPYSLGNLLMLQELWLNDNALTTLPESLSSEENLPNLYYLDLRNNPLTSSHQNRVVVELKERGRSVEV